MRNRQRGRTARVRQHGLTLIELLVAISVLAFVAVLGWRGLDGIVRARVALTGDLELTRGMQLTFAQLQNDCAHLVAISAMPNRAPLVAEQDRLTLVRTVFADNQPSRLQVITYRLRNGVLTRRESAATRDLKELDTLWQIAASDADLSQSVVLQSGVSAIAMRLWDGNAWRTSNGNAAQQAAGPGTSPNPNPNINNPNANPNPNINNPNANSATTLPLLTGLEVTLQLQGREARMLKVFLLGAV